MEIKKFKKPKNGFLMTFNSRDNLADKIKDGDI